MQPRLITSLACAVCFVCAGLLSDYGMKKRCRGLDIAIDAIRQLEYQITVLETPLREAAEALSQSSPLFARLRADPQGGLHAAAEEIGLRNEDIQVLLKLRRAIPIQTKGNRKDFEFCLKTLLQHKEYAEKRREREGAIHRKLGLLAGAAVFVLLC